MNISIFASIWCQNLWDELILKNEILLLEKKYAKEGEKVFFRVFTYDMDHHFFIKKNVEYREYFPIGLKKNKSKNIANYIQFLKTIFWSDLIVIWGGGLFYDSEKQSSTKNLELWKMRTNHFRFFHKSFIFYGVSIDTKRETSPKKIKKIFSGAQNIFVRDEYSRKYLYELKLHSHIIDDPVMSDNPLYNPRRKSCIKILDSKAFDLRDIADIDVKGKRIGIAFRAGYLSSIWSKEVEVAKMWELIHFLIGHGAKKIVLLPHSFHKTDIQANDYLFLRQFISSKVDIADSMKDVYESYTQKTIELCFSMRLHSIILSEVYAIPYIAFSYSQKTFETLKKLTR